MSKTLILLFITLLSSSVLGSPHFYSVTEYFKLHPEQIERSVEFEKYVKEAAQPTAIDFSHKIKISIIYPGIQISDYWRRSVITLRKRLEELKIPFTISEFHFKPSCNLVDQEQQVADAISNTPDYLIFTLDAQNHRRIIERILADRKTKVILQNLTTPLRFWENHQPFFYVGFDHLIGAQKIADSYIKRTNGNGKYAVLYFTRGVVSEQRGDEFIRYIKENSKLTLVSAFYTDGTKEDGQRVTAKILKDHPDIKFIYACATDIALGAAAELKRQKLKDRILINGWGGGSAELEALKNNDFDFTIMRMNDDNGVAMAEAISLDTRGKNQTIPLVYSGEFALLDKSMKEDEIKKYTNYAFRYSNAGN